MYGLDINWMELYLDDSGSRLPDFQPAPEQTDAMDCFALGGILFEANEVYRLIKAYNTLCKKWNINYPLHSNEIRMSSENFVWVGALNVGEREEFYQDIARMIEEQPFVTMACVISRPGYNTRYKSTYGENRWMLCRTAYSIVVERATKFALRKDLPLRVHFETTGKSENRHTINYQRDLKKIGAPFAAGTSSKYSPLDAATFRKVLLGDPLQHTKASIFCQLADLVLYPMVRGKFNPAYRPYQHLKKAGKLIDCVLPATEIEEVGIKYSCFD